MVATVLINGYAGYVALKRQTTNGDNRTLRQALDDLALSFTEHKGEVKAHLEDIKDRLTTLESGRQ